MEGEIAGIAQDRASGASALGGRGARALQLLATSSVSETPERFRQQVAEAGRALIEAQPAMAPLIRLANEAVTATQAARDLDTARKALKAVASGFATRQSAEADDVAQHALGIIPAEATILTHSASETVLSTLLSARRNGQPFSVICSESRPNLEGRTLASRLAEKGIEVRVVVDALAPSLASGADLMIVGADAASAEGIVNKAGTYPLALAASRAGIPCYILCGTAKFLPSGHSVGFRDEDPAEVWEEPSPGIQIENRYFDLTPWELVRGVITGAGILSPEEVQKTIAARPLHPELR